MKAPDKIYLYREQPKDYFDEDWHELPASDVENVVYIRKDTLLEWLEERNKEINGLSKALWRSLEIKVLYDKLNSM